LSVTIKVLGHLRLVVTILKKPMPPPAPRS